MKKKFFLISIGIAGISILAIIFLASGLWKYFFYPKTNENKAARIVIPQEANSYFGTDRQGQTIWEENLNTLIPMERDEIVIAVLNREREESYSGEQFVAYINSNDNERRVHIAYISFNERGRTFRRQWNAPTAVTRSETLSLFTQDLIGDRNDCIVITGMNSRNEHTMTIFRRNRTRSTDQVFNKIAELQIDGSIIIQETGRSLAYQQGITMGQSFNIAAYSADASSSNLLDQIEIIYSFNPVNEQYEQISFARIPGSQIEQQRLRELLSGTPGVFDSFINDLWYYLSPQGTIDLNQYIYFDPSGREIIFFGDESQQVFRWHASMPTRYGIYIRSQNISISTLLRFVDIELLSLDSIRLRVIEDVRLRISAHTTWDGSYRRAGVAMQKETVSSIRPAINALYDSFWGRIQFNSNGEYIITSGSLIRTGRYVFYKVNEQELLELRPGDIGETNESRMIYKIEAKAAETGSGAAGGVNPFGNSSLTLSRVRLGISGIQDLFESPVTLTPVTSG
ncbi:MAG: pallilysin-related adhesin [Treponema sp.]|jgi:hypothetical protein|nr:pallilysin-related adhesin [Treponema sp.]